MLNCNLQISEEIQETQAFDSVTLCLTLHQHVAVVAGARHRRKRRTTAFPGDTEVPC